jgi:hypothetical protein
MGVRINFGAQWFTMLILSIITLYFVHQHTSPPEDGFGNKTWYYTQKGLVLANCGILIVVSLWALVIVMSGKPVMLTNVFGGCECQV